MEWRVSCQAAYAPNLVVSLVGVHVPAGLGYTAAGRSDKQAASDGLRQRRAVVAGAGCAWGAHPHQLLGRQHGCRGQRSRTAAGSAKRPAVLALAG